jgi:hypothetical protein
LDDNSIIIKFLPGVWYNKNAQHSSVVVTITINENNAYTPIMVDAVVVDAVVGSPCRTKPVGLSSPKLSELAAFLFLVPVFPLRPVIAAC